MSTTILTLLFTLAIFTLAVAGLGVRMLFVKGGEFRGGCASNNPMLTDEIGTCQVCGATKGEACQKPEEENNEGDSSLKDPV